MFELLAPYFAVAGGLLAGVPIVLHMLRRTPAIRMPFSVVRFLTPTLPKTTKRSTLEHWPLMLLRILAITLIALAFSRPFQRLTVAKEAESESADRIMLLLDASASMRRDGLREAVIAEIESVAAELNPEDTLSVASYSESSRNLITAAEWRQTDAGSRAALIQRAIVDYEPDWLSTNTANAMLEAADEVAREQGSSGLDGDRSVILITDFQLGSELDELRTGKWPDSVKLDLRIVAPTSAGNAGLSLAEDERSGRIRVRVTNSGDAAMTKYLLQPFDAKGVPVGTPLTAEVGGGNRRTFTMPETVEGQPQIVGVELLGDAHPFDNVVDLPIDERAVIRVAHAGSLDANNADAMRYYLQRAIDGSETVPVYVIDLLGSDGVAIPAPENVRLVFVTETIPESLAKSLGTLIDRGGVVLMALKSPEMAESVKSLLPENLSITEADVKDYSMLGRIDFSDSLLAPFADARFADFSSIRFWKHRLLSFDEKQPDAPHVVARFDSGPPAIIEISRPSGGRVIVLASGWHPDDSQWALSTRFPPMIHRLISLANPRRSGHQLCEVGHRIDAYELSGAAAWTLLRPDGTLFSAIPATTAPEAAMTAVPVKSVSALVTLDQPGRWTLTGDAGQGPKSISLLVTVAASESRTDPLPAGQLQAIGLSSDVASVKTTNAALIDPSAAAQLDASELESRQKFWRWLLLAGLSCLVLEALLSFGIERRQQSLGSFVSAEPKIGGRDGPLI